MSAEDDARDVRAVLAGDVDAFAGLVARWQRPLVNLAYRFSRDAASAEEMAQEAFLRAFRSLASYRGDAAFSTWLFALATNTFRSWQRRYRPPMLPIDDIAATAIAPEQSDGVFDRDRASLLHREIAALPERFRAAILLFHFHELDLAATASSLGLPIGTVKSHLHRGRALLEKRLRAESVATTSFPKGAL